MWLLVYFTLHILSLLGSIVLESVGMKNSEKLSLGGSPCGDLGYRVEFWTPLMGIGVTDSF
jgi:hypothetical protein